MKRISMISSLTAILLLGSALLLYAQTTQADKATVEQQAGKSFIIEFADPSGNDLSAAKKHGLIPLTPGEELSEELRQKLRGQSIKLVTGSDGQFYLKILHPDSADAMNRHAFDVLSGNAEARPPEFDPFEVWRSHLEETAERQMTELPLRIRTEAQSGNRLEITVENRTDSSITDVNIIPARLPGGWKIDPAELKADVIVAHSSALFTVWLETPAGAEAGQIGFQLQSDRMILPWTVRVQPAASGDENLPDKFELHGNYPNPFNPATTISYSLPESMHITVEIYDIIGRRVARLVNQQQGAGTHNVVWDASSAASGTYLYRLVGRSESNSVVFEEGRLTLIK